jgi:hypothetical protein
VKGGVVALSVGSYPAYLVLPAAAKIEPVAERWGTNVALTRLGATAEATSELGTQPAVSAIDGNTASGSCWRSLVPNELPHSVTVTLAGPTPINRTGIWGYAPRGYDLEATDAAGKWLKLASRRDEPFQRFRAVAFNPVVTDQVRLTVVDSYTDRAEVAELQLFSPAADVGQAVALVNWALKTSGATARASSEMKKEVTTAQQDWGAKEPRIMKVLLEGKAENAIDGKRLIGGWRDFFPTTWVAAEGAAGSQWLEVTFAGPKKINTVTVYTIAFAGWTPATSGIRAWDVQVWDGNQWKPVDTVADNVKVSHISRLRPAVTTDKFRIVVNATNDPMGTIGIMEVEAYGPRQ